MQETVTTMRVIQMPRKKTLLVYCDASLSNLKDGRTQVSMVMGWVDTEKYRHTGTSPFSIQE
eukprot:397821-Amphidinium_carterae.1